MWIWPSAAFTMAVTTSSVGLRTPAASFGRPRNDPAWTTISAAPPITTSPTRTGTDLRRALMASSQHIVICHKSDQSKQESETDVVHHLLPCRVDRSAANQLEHEEGRPPTVQRRKGKDIRHPQAEA